MLSAPVTLPASPQTLSQGEFSLRWLLMVGALLLLWNLGYAPFWNPDEGRYAAAAQEMAHPFDGGSSDWVVPHLNTIPRLNKPPLVYWLAAFSYRIFGTSERAGRLVSALAAILVMVGVWTLGRAMFSARAGVASALVWSTSVLPYAMGHVLNTDMLLCCAITLTFCGIWFGLEGQRLETGPEATKAQRLKGYGLAGLGMGLALLDKGPVGIALPLGITFAYLCWARRWRIVQWQGVLLSLALAIILALPWYWAVSLRDPNFLHSFIFQENLARFSGTKEFHKKQSVFFYVPVIIGGLFPWVAFLVPAVARFRNRNGTTDKVELDTATTNSHHARLFLWLWAGLLILFFSFSSVKLVSYVLPAFPALALLVGDALSERNWGQTAPSYRAALIITAFLYALIIVVLPIALLNEHITLFGHQRRLPGNTLMPIGEIQPFVFILCGVLLISLLCLLWHWRTRDAWKLVMSQFATGAVLFIILLQLASHIALYEDASAMAKTLQPFLQPGDQVMQYQTFQPSLSFYARQPVTIFDYVKNSGLDEAIMERSKYFHPRNAQTMTQILSSPKHVYVLMRTDNVAKHNLPKTHYIVAQTNAYWLISNRPAPPNFHYDFVAPRKRNP